MRLAATALVLAMGAVAHADPQQAERPPGEAGSVVAAAPVKDPTRWKPVADTSHVVHFDPTEHPGGADGRPADGKSPVVSVVLPIAVMVAGISLLPIVDQQEFEARGGAKTAWNALGWTGIAAFVVGPSLGQIYAGNPWNTGLKIRLLGAATMATGVTIAATGPHSGAATLTARDGVGLLIALLGAIPYVGGSLYEIGTSPRAVHAHNERARRTPMTVIPAIGGATLGVTLVGAF